MTWKLMLTGVLGLALGVPSWSEPGEEFPEGPKPEEKEEMPDSDEESMEEEQIDVLGTLESIIGKMKDAEDHLAKAGAWKATDAQGNVIEDANKLIDAKDLQNKAVQEMNRIFDGSKKEQQTAISEIEKLIKAAKESS